MGTNNQTNWLIITKNMVSRYDILATILSLIIDHIFICKFNEVFQKQNDEIKEKRWIGCKHGNAHFGVSDSWEAMKLKPTTRKIWEKFLAKK